MPAAGACLHRWDRCMPFAHMACDTTDSSLLQQTATDSSPPVAVCWCAARGAVRGGQQVQQGQPPYLRTGFHGAQNSMSAEQMSCMHACAPRLCEPLQMRDSGAARQVARVTGIQVQAVLRVHAYVRCLA
eukprot:jgi/Ulvmu1/10641/UM066_0021.1